MITLDELVASDDLSEAALTALIAQSDAEHTFDGTVLPPGTDGFDAARWERNEGIDATRLVLSFRRGAAARAITEAFRSAQTRVDRRAQRLAERGVLPSETTNPASASSVSSTSSATVVDSSRESDIERTLSPIEQLALEAELVELKPMQQSVLPRGGAKP